MERERGQVAHVAQGPDPAELPRLLGEARAEQGLNRIVLAGRINSLLIAMRAPGNESAEAKAILSELDVSSFNGLVDGHGRTCRKEAVETLLACGFPHALEVNPEDLRRGVSQRGRRETDGIRSGDDRESSEERAKDELPVSECPWVLVRQSCGHWRFGSGEPFGTPFDSGMRRGAGAPGTSRPS